VGVRRYHTVCVENAQKNGSPPSVVASVMGTEFEYGSAPRLMTVAFAKLSFGGGAARATSGSRTTTAASASGIRA
jgi:hypothetical protein